MMKNSVFAYDRAVRSSETSRNQDQDCLPETAGRTENRPNSSVELCSPFDLRLQAEVSTRSIPTNQVLYTFLARCHASWLCQRFDVPLVRILALYASKDWYQHIHHQLWCLLATNQTPFSKVRSKNLVLTRRFITVFITASHWPFSSS